MAFEIPVPGFQGDDDWVLAAVGGVEYTFNDVFESGGDLGLLLEYAYDDRDSGRAPPTIFDNDIMMGTRFSLNDESNFYFEGGVLIDLDHDEQVYVLNMSRRMTDNLTMALEGRIFANGNGFLEDGLDPVVLSAINRDDYITLKAALPF